MTESLHNDSGSPQTQDTGLLDALIRSGRISHAREKIRAQLELENAGYQFYYFIDTYDLEEYCLPSSVASEIYAALAPRGTNEEREIGKTYWRTSKWRELEEAQATYMLLIGKLTKRLFLLDEYAGEYNAMRDYLEQLRQRGLRAEGILTDLLLSIRAGEGIVDPSVSDEIRKQTPYLLMLTNSILLVGMERYRQLEREKLVVSISDPVFNELGTGVKDALHNCVGTSNLSTLIARTGRAINTQDVRARINLAVDCKAADVVISFNRALAELESKPKVRFLLLSSTPTKSERLEDRAIDIYSISPSDNPFRSVSEVLLGLVMRNTENDQRGVKKEKSSEGLDPEFYNLSKSVDQLLGKSRSFETANKAFLDLDRPARSWLSVSASDFIGYGLVARVEKVKAEVERAIERVDHSKGDEGLAEARATLTGILRAMLQEAKATDVRRRAREKLRELVFDANYVTILSMAVHRLVANEVELKPVVGDSDAVMATWQRLPILFKLKEARLSGLIDSITELYMLPGARRVHSDQLWSSIRSYIEHIFAPEDGDHEQEVLRILLLLLLPHEDHWRDVEAVIYLRLKDLLTIDSDYLSEYLYLACWVARRLGKTDLAKGHANEGIKRYRGDARFQHGLCLAYWSEYKASPNKRGSLLPCVRAGRSALKEYELQEPETGGVPKQLRYCRISVWNTLAYALVKMAEGKDAGRHLTEAWAYVNEIKKELGTAEYEQYPEFMETEAAMLFNIHSKRMARSPRKETDKESDLIEARRLCKECQRLAKERGEENNPYMKYVNGTLTKVEMTLSKLGIAY